MLVRRADADALGLTTIDDLRRVEAQWRPGFGYEFAERADGYAGLLNAYELRFTTPPRVMELDLVYRALPPVRWMSSPAMRPAASSTRSTSRCSRDNRSYFPPYYAVPDRALGRAAGASRAEGRAQRARRTNLRRRHACDECRVDVDHRDVAAAVQDFLRVKLPN